MPLSYGAAKLLDPSLSLSRLQICFRFSEDSSDEQFVWFYSHMDHLLNLIVENVCHIALLCDDITVDGCYLLPHLEDLLIESPVSHNPFGIKDYLEWLLLAQGGTSKELKHLKLPSLIPLCESIKENLSWTGWHHEELLILVSIY